MKGFENEFLWVDIVSEFREQGIEITVKLR